MSKPICDFVRKYAKSNAARFHMPGHKGVPFLGFESFDITEIDGADELFTASGIIAESEQNASETFGAKTFYSTGGSTLCIEAMMRLIAVYAVSKGKTTTVLAGRNAHKAFLNAAALLDIRIKWLRPEKESSYLCCPISADDVENALSQDKKPTAVYLTSPDYLGNILDIKSISAVCKKHGVILCVDNAHGAYLRFLQTSLFPTDLGADMCCSSAHKTLPVITGGAYLHISQKAPKMFATRAKESMSLFGSSSPSYLILQSLDAMNDEAENFREALLRFLPKAEILKKEIKSLGFDFLGNEPLKITLATKSYGYTGTEVAKIMMSDGIYPEFYDPDTVVFMLSPKNTDTELAKLKGALADIKKRTAITSTPPALPLCGEIMRPREAIFKENEDLPVEECVGLICAAAAISCPPAIPVAVYGERITEKTVEVMKYYGITHCSVIKQI